MSQGLRAGTTAQAATPQKRATAKPCSTAQPQPSQIPGQEISAHSWVSPRGHPVLGSVTAVGHPADAGPLLYSCGQEVGSCGHLCSWTWPLHLTIAPFLWHPRVSEMRVLSPLFADPYLVRNCSGLKEVFFIGWRVGREAPPYALCFHDQGIERSEETPILGPSHTALIVALSIGQEETMSSWCLISFPFWGGLVTPDNGHGASFWHGVLPTHHLSPLQD